MRMNSDAGRTDEPRERAARASTSVSGPSRPTNMPPMSTSRAGSGIAGVMPVVRPTVQTPKPPRRGRRRTTAPAQDLEQQRDAEHDGQSQQCHGQRSEHDGIRDAAPESLGGTTPAGGRDDRGQQHAEGVHLDPAGRGTGRRSDEHQCHPDEQPGLGEAAPGRSRQILLSDR